MSSRQKIMIAMLAMFALAIISSVIAVMINRKQEKILTQYNHEQHQRTCEAVLKMHSSRVDQIVFDYTFWDDFVEFVQKPEPEWGKENISTILSSFNIDAAWMVNLRKSVVYSDFKEEAKLLNELPYDTSIFEQLNKNHFVSHYQFTPLGLMYVHGATIHPTSDPQRLTPPQGYFFLAKIWDEDFVTDIEKLTGSKLEIKAICKDTVRTLSKFELQTSFPIKTWKNEEIGTFVFCQQLPFMELYKRTSNQMLFLFISTAILILLSITILIRSWVSNPLSLVGEIISTESLEKLPLLEEKSADFLRIGQMIETFIHQKNELEKAKVRAEEADRLKSAFLANMSHEIRTPLFGILGFAELLRDRDVSEEVRLNYLNIVLNSGQHLLSLINDVIDLSKIESGVMTLNNEEFNVDELLIDLYQFFASSNYLKDRKVNLKLSTELNDNSVLIKCDYKRVKQVLTNLISNALKFTAEGEVEFGYKIASAKEIVFFVRDTGIGIAHEMQEKIFDRFIQVDNNITSRQFEGTGLGLSISKALVGCFGGQLWLESELNRGSLFSFSLPVTINIITGNGQPLIIPDQNLSVNQSDLQGAKILIVDDFEHNIMLFKSMIEKAGGAVFQAKSGEEALVQVKEGVKFDIILLDIRLRGMDGFEAAQEIKKMGLPSKIVVHTAYSDDENWRKAMQVGCDDFFTKPISNKEFINRLINLLD